MKTTEIAKTAKIAPRTRKFGMVDDMGYSIRMGRSEAVLCTLGRSDLTPGLDQRTRTVVNGLTKCYTTGRMNPELARRVRETYSPYQLCALVARIAEQYQGAPTIGDLADFWINRHANEL